MLFNDMELKCISLTQNKRRKTRNNAYLSFKSAYSIVII